jgi:hypothetical protein
VLQQALSLGRFPASSRPPDHVDPVLKPESEWRKQVMYCRSRPEPAHLLPLAHVEANSVFE